MSVPNIHNVLEVSNLYVGFRHKDEDKWVVKGISFDMRKGEVLGIIGESGSGKTITALTLMNLLEKQKALLVEGVISYDLSVGKRLVEMPDKHDMMAQLRGKSLAYIFQDSFMAFSPVKKCGDHLVDVIKKHQGLSHAVSKKKAIDLLKEVSLNDATSLYDRYPYQLSGGQLQRVQIAVALAGEPELLICDEPTTALDPITEKEILNLLKKLIGSRSLSVIFISHDLNVIKDMCDRVLVMHQGVIVDQGVWTAMENTTSDPYFRQLLSGLQPMKETRSVVANQADPRRIAKLSIKDLSLNYRRHGLMLDRKDNAKALTKLKLELHQGEILGIVGDSGSGKTSLAKCIVGLEKPDEGVIQIDGVTISHSNRDYYSLARKVQMIFQDAYSSLNPIMTVGDQIEAVINRHKLLAKAESIEQKIDGLLAMVDLDATVKNRFPHQLSGGQRQRINIARALSLSPEILICDEITSSLDFLVQETIMQFLLRIRKSNNISIIMISHDHSLISRYCDRVGILKNGLLEGPISIDAFLS